VLSPSRRVQEGTDLSGPQQAGAEVGTVCHRALQILYSQPAVTVAAAVRQAALETALAEREAPAAQIILPFSQTALFDQLKTCELLAAEMPFSFLSEKGAVETGIMDALFKAADGSIWVVDYKTDQIPAQGPQALLEKYRPQLAVYQQAAQRLFPELRVQTLLVLLRTGAAIPLVGDFPAET